jgi:hypothetical protein
MTRLQGAILNMSAAVSSEYEVGAWLRAPVTDARRALKRESILAASFLRCRPVFRVHNICRRRVRSLACRHPRELSMIAPPP